MKSIQEEMALVSQFLEYTPKEINKLIESVCNEVDEGWADPLKLFIACKKAMKIFEGIAKNIGDTACNQTKLNNGEHHIVFGCDISKSMQGVSYDFKTCNDPVLNAYLEQLKERQDYLKSLKGETEVINEDTGELYPIYPPVKKGKEGLVIKMINEKGK